MPIQSLTSNMPVLPAIQAEQAGAPATLQGKPAKASSAGKDSVAVANSTVGDALFQSLQSGKSTLVSLAKSVQKVDTVMDVIGQNIDKMKSDITAVVKNFPPFAPGSEDRLKFLKSFNSLRQQIDALTIPPPNDSNQLSKIMADPKVIPGAGDVAVKLSAAGLPVTVTAKELHTGPKGLNIPALPATPPNDATDAQIYKAIDNLDTARKTLAEKKAALAEEAALIGRFFGEGPMFKKINASLDLQVGSKIASEITSGTTPELAVIADTGIAGKRSQLLQNMLG